ncbi:MAG: hypothetical protein FJ087_00375 [Deltaproteobacteria bacterium]|nr:hypothetical protein [Deltaproteobacteria bacterium]
MTKETRAWRIGRVAFPTVAGAILGYLYWAEVGCTTGGCPLTSNPFLTTGFGALIGLNLGWPSRRPGPDAGAGTGDSNTP